jgi:hypothetical protein
MRKTKHVPMWVRRMRRGWLRDYLIAVFLPLTRSERRELYW